MWPLITLGIALTSLLLIALTWWYRGNARYFDGRMDEKERWQENARKAAERRMTGQPPADWYLPPPPPKAPAGAMLPGEIPGGGAVSSPVMKQPRPAITDIPVMSPRPGVRIPLAPQAARDSGAGTTAMPKLTDTGELRFEEWLKKMKKEDTEWRKERGLDQ